MRAARTFGPADPADEMRQAIDRLSMLPDTPLAVAMAQVLAAAVAEMDGVGAVELLDSSSAQLRAADLPQVCDRSGPRPACTAAPTLARAVLAPRSAPTGAAARKAGAR
jgi:hypothetical protein